MIHCVVPCSQWPMSSFPFSFSPQHFGPVGVISSSWLRMCRRRCRTLASQLTAQGLDIITISLFPEHKHCQGQQRQWWWRERVKRTGLTWGREEDKRERKKSSFCPRGSNLCSVYSCTNLSSSEEGNPQTTTQPICSILWHCRRYSFLAGQLKVVKHINLFLWFPFF